MFALDSCFRHCHRQSNVIVQSQYRLPNPLKIDAHYRNLNLSIRKGKKNNRIQNEKTRDKKKLVC